MKRTNKKRAFTIVELVIVIAVIAILAAVLIPTFSGIIQKANVSKDTQLIRNLNTALITDKATGGSHPTMYDALQAAEKAGYLVDKINASAVDNEILWDSVNDCFCYFESGKIVYIPEVTTITENLLNEDGSVSDDNAHKFWRIYDAKPSEQKYSIYASNNWTEATVDVSVGFDAGDCTKITNVNYENSTEKNVVIRTNSKEITLEIKAPNDVIKHYDVVGAVNIIECKTSSYHEYGKVDFLEIAKGRVALEAGAEVEQLHFDAQTASGFDEIIVAADPSVTLPVFSRDDVTIPDGGTLVVELQKDTNNDTNTDKDYIWLYQQGLVQQIRISESATEISDVKATDAGVDAKTAKAADEIANNLKPGANYTAAQIEEGTVSAEDVEKTGLTEEAKNEIKQEIKEAGEAERVAEEKKEDVNAVAWNKTSDEYFDNLYDAFASVDANGTKTTIILLKNVSGVSNKNYEIAVGQNIVFDLNGNTMNTVAADDKTAYAILNNGTLTIKDSTDKKKDGSGNGKLEIKALSPDLQQIPGYASNLITNNGTLVVESGWLHNNSAATAAFAIDTGANTSVTVNGGKITTYGSLSIRQRAETTGECNVTINGGIIGSYWIQNYGKTGSPYANLLITGGRFLNQLDLNIAYYAYSNNDYGNANGENVHVTITGNPVFEKYITICDDGSEEGIGANIEISGGTFLAEITYYGNQKFIKGGSFVVSPILQSYGYPFAIKDGGGFGFYDLGSLLSSNGTTLEEILALSIEEQLEQFGICLEYWESPSVVNKQYGGSDCYDVSYYFTPSYSDYLIDGYIESNVGEMMVVVAE